MAMQPTTSIDDMGRDHGAEHGDEVQIVGRVFH